VLERAEQLARRKNIYEEVYPQTKRGIAGAASRWENDATPDSGVASFNEDTHLKTGMSKSLIYENVQIANAIAPDVKEALRETPLANRKTELLKIAQMKPEQQRAVVERISSGAQTVTEASRLAKRKETH
jgi:ParB family chromosome partitioning protein